MIDFAKLKRVSERVHETDPVKLFDGLPKSGNVNDLYNGQASVLAEWNERRSEPDVVIKMPTGAGKTIVGLMISQSYMNETSGPAIYLVESRQLVDQVLEQAKKIGVRASPYTGRDSVDSSFLNGESLLVCSYQAMFNGKSVFDRFNQGSPVDLSCVVVDDAHAALEKVRDAFSLVIHKAEHQSLFDRLTAGLNAVFDGVNQGATYRELVDAVPGTIDEVLEVPYWAYMSMLGSIERDIAAEMRKLRSGCNTDESLTFTWPLVKDGLRYCRMIVGCGRVTIAPYVPELSCVRAFAGAAHRVYMSATFADESSVVRVFDVGAEAISRPVASRGLAGIGMKLLLPVPDGAKELAGLAKECASAGHGSVVLCPSRAATWQWDEFGIHSVEGDQVAKAVRALNEGGIHVPIAFMNRYNGVDLPDEACRLLIVDGLPEGGMGDVDRLEQKYLSSSAYYARVIAQRVEQGIGRASRGSSDYCAVALHGRRLVEWVRNRRNAIFFSRETRALLQVGENVALQLGDMGDVASVLKQVVDGDSEFMGYCAAEVAEMVGEEADLCSDSDIETARVVRSAVRLWRDNHGLKAVDKLEKYAEHMEGDRQLAGYLTLLAARIAYQMGDSVLAQRLHHKARGLNPAVYPFGADESLAGAVDWQVENVLARSQGGLEKFDRSTRTLDDKEAGSTEYEMALESLGGYLGFESLRCDKEGEGPDVFWKTGDGLGFVIEVKSDKKADSIFDKREQGQLQVAVLWCKENHPDLQPVPVSIHPTALAFPQAHAEGTLVLTIEQAGLLRSCVRKLVEVSKGGRPLECSGLLDELALRPKRLIEKYMQRFKQVDRGSDGAAPKPGGNLRHVVQ